MKLTDLNIGDQELVNVFMCLYLLLGRCVEVVNTVKCMLLILLITLPNTADLTVPVWFSLIIFTDKVGPTQGLQHED